MAYLNVVASKLMHFIEEMSIKCQTFGNQINNIANNNTNIAYPQSKPKTMLSSYEPKSAYGERNMHSGDSWLSRANRTLDRGIRGANPQHYLLRQPKWLSTYTSDYYL